MGWLGSGLTLPVSCLILVWAAGSGSVKVLHQPTCFSDYISTSTCEWGLDGPANCSAELRLTYQLDFSISENLTCVPENRESTLCLCNMLMDVGMAIGDTYQLDLWTGTQLLWSGSFTPSEHVKPPAPGNLSVLSKISHTWQLTWSNPYPSDNFLYSELRYLVNMSNDGNPTEFSVYNVTSKEPVLYIPASTLKPGTSYSARVKAWVPSYDSSWSEWSPSVKWFNYYKWPWEKHLPLAISITCLVISVICLSCYFSVIKIKKGWWDQIPNPAHSPLMAIVFQEPEVPPWWKRPGVQEPARSPHWKTCLNKLLPCLLEHGVEQDGTSSKAARKGPFQGPGKPAWCPVEVGRTVLRPESISVVKCVELLEAPGEWEEEEVEEGEGSFCPSPESSGGGFQESRAGIAARMTESLFLDLLGGDKGGFWPQGLEESCLLPPADSVSAPMPLAELPSKEPAEKSVQSRGQLFYPEPAPPATLTQSAACLTLTETPAVITDNPSYRRLSSLSRSLGPAEPDADPELAEPWGEGDPGTLSAPQPSEPETWEQVLRQSILQHRVAPTPATAPTGGYREFVHAVQQGSAPGTGSAGFCPSGDAGYKAFASLLASGNICPGPSGAEAGSVEGSYRPFQSLASGCPGVPAPGPLFTFGLDTEPPHSPQNSLLPGSSPEHPGLEPVAKGEDSQKPPLSLEQATDPLRDDLGSGIVYSALTCHLCGHLKQCHGQEERGKAHIVASPCCGCCCGDSSEPPVSPVRAPDPLPGGVPLEASLPPASLAPFGVLKGGNSSLFFQPGPSSAQSSSHTPKMAVAVLSTGPTCTSVP
ncbi:interleukin-4 receptor subunit alpha isoform 1-T3 [Rhynchonycteris naso]